MIVETDIKWAKGNCRYGLCSLQLQNQNKVVHVNQDRNLGKDKIKCDVIAPVKQNYIFKAKL